MTPLPPSALPPPPFDRAAFSEQGWRIRRQRSVRAVFLAALMIGSGASLWVLSAGESATRAEWAFRMTHVTDLQARGLDGTGEVVCLVDTGIDSKHPDLASVPILGWKDFVKNRTAPYDDDGHGTAMAGLIAARGTLSGIAPGVSLLVAKALDAHGVGTSDGLAAAIAFCADPDGDGNATDAASIVSLSLAASRNVTLGPAVTLAVNAALAKGVLIVASAGNDGLEDDGDVQNPASIPGVIAVGAVDSFGAIARFSSIGASVGRWSPDLKPELVAPGVDLLTTARGGGYRLVSGTSASAAFVSGILALILQGQPNLSHAAGYRTVVAVKTALMVGAIPGPTQQVPHDPHYGYGLVGAATAMAALA